MRTTALRIDDGQALRDAMKQRGAGLARLSALTRDADPAGRGVSVALLGFLTQPSAASRHARQTCSPETAGLIETALGAPAQSLFRVVEAGDRSDPQPSWDDLAPEHVIPGNVTVK